MIKCLGCGMVSLVGLWDGWVYEVLLLLYVGGVDENDFFFFVIVLVY